MGVDKCEALRKQKSAVQKKKDDELKKQVLESEAKKAAVRKKAAMKAQVTRQINKELNDAAEDLDGAEYTRRVEELNEQKEAAMKALEEGNKAELPSRFAVGPKGEDLSPNTTAVRGLLKLGQNSKYSRLWNFSPQLRVSMSPSVVAQRVINKLADNLIHLRQSVGTDGIPQTQSIESRLGRREGQLAGAMNILAGSVNKRTGKVSGFMAVKKALKVNGNKISLSDFAEVAGLALKRVRRDADGNKAKNTQVNFASVLDILRARQRGDTDFRHRDIRDGVEQEFGVDTTLLLSGNYSKYTDADLLVIAKHAEDVAEQLRLKSYDPVARELKGRGLLPETAGKAKPKAPSSATVDHTPEGRAKAAKKVDEVEEGTELDEAYAPRLYDIKKIMDNEERFKAIVKRWLLRSGRATTDKKADEIAHDTFNKIVGRDTGDDSIIPGSGTGSGAYADFHKVHRPDRTKARTLLIPSDELEEFTINNIAELTSNYLRNTGGFLELDRAFGDVNLDREIAAIRKDFDKLREALHKDKSMTANQRSKAINSLSSIERDNIAVINAVRDKILGTFMQKDANSFGTKFVKTLNNVQYARLLGDVVTSSLADSANIAITHGFRRQMGGMVDLMQRNLRGLEKDFTRKELQEVYRVAGTVIETTLNKRFSRWADVNDYSYSAADKSVGLAKQMADAMGKWSFFNGYTDVMKGLASYVSQKRIFDFVNDIKMDANGNITMKQGAELNRLRHMGFGDNDLKRMKAIRDFMNLDANKKALSNTEELLAESPEFWLAAAAKAKRNVGTKGPELRDRSVLNAERATARSAARKAAKDAGKSKDEIIAAGREASKKFDEAEAAKRVDNTDEFMKTIEDDLDYSARDYADAKRLLDEGASGKRESKILADMFDDNPNLFVNQVLELRSRYYAALNKDVQATIVTPGLADIPLILQDNAFGRFMGILRSFVFGSWGRLTLRTMNPNTDRGAWSPGPVAAGIIESLALGMLVHWIKTKAKGKEFEYENVGTWMFEGLDRSGILAVPMELDNMASNIGPGWSIRKLLGVDASSRRRHANVIRSVLGANIGLTEDVNAFVRQALTDPVSAKTFGKAIRLAPFQTLFYAREGWRALEGSGSWTTAPRDTGPAIY